MRKMISFFVLVFCFALTGCASEYLNIPEKEVDEVITDTIASATEPEVDATSEYNWRLLSLSHTDSEHAEGIRVAFKATLSLDVYENIHSFGVVMKQPCEGEYELFTKTGTEMNGLYIWEGTIRLYQSKVPFEFSLFIKEKKDSIRKVVQTYTTTMAKNREYEGEFKNPVVERVQLLSEADWNKSSEE